MVKPTDASPDDSSKKKITTEHSDKPDQSTEPSEQVMDATQDDALAQLSEKTEEVDEAGENESSIDPEPIISFVEDTPENQDPALDSYPDEESDTNPIDDDFIEMAAPEQKNEDEMLQQVAGVFLLWWNWAYFEISIVQPDFPVFEPPDFIQPEVISGSSEMEFTYAICDHGNRLSTSKGAEMYSVGMSMCKMFYTIEKMIFILVERLKKSGVDGKTEVQVSFDGHLLAQRKAFESIINLNYNVVVTNFDPGVWGERYLEIVKRLADKGYGYPTEAPRNIYKSSKRSSVSVKR